MLVYQAGDTQPDEEMSLRFGGLLNDAINKKPPYPLTVFLDTNLPPTTVKRFYEPQSTAPIIPPKLMIQLLERIRKEHDGKDPINLVIFTNHPHHYVKATDSDPIKNMAFVLSQVPTQPTQNQQTLISLYEAANKYGTIPHELPRAE